MSEEKAKLLALMRFWLFGTFVIVLAAITGYIGLFTDRNWVNAFVSGLPIWGITAVTCVILYVGYSLWLRRRSG